MPAFTRVGTYGGSTGRPDLLASLRATELVTSKPVLPAEIISTILDFLPIPDLLRFARVSKRMQEMVYDDTRWVQRLQSMGCWNETEARKRFEDAMRRKHGAQKAKQSEEAVRAAGMVSSTSSRPINDADEVKQASVMLFDASEEEQRRKNQIGSAIGNVVDGFDALAISFSTVTSDHTSSRPTITDPISLLTVLSNVRSIRGFARQEYGRVYGALAPLYFDLAKSRNHTDPVVFRLYREPEQQAQMLSQLKIFAKSDLYQGWHLREEKLNAMMGIFENAVLREFEQAYEIGDVDGKMRRYAHVLAILNGGQAGVELFIHKHPIMFDKERFGTAMDCINQASSGNIALEPSHDFFSRLLIALNEQSSIIDRVFPPNVNVMYPFLERIGEDVISEYVTPLFDEAHERNIESYLKAVAGIYEQCCHFGQSLRPTKASGSQFSDDVAKVLARVFEPHVDLFLQEELDFFRRSSDAEVSGWDKKIHEQDAATESFFMANINRQADKKDFLSSFKKVVMMPVNALPSIPISSPFAVSKPTTHAPPNANGSSLEVATNQFPRPPSRSVTPGFDSPGELAAPQSGPATRSTSPAPAPTTELAAKAAIMSSKLKGIRSLFSIEVALNLVHTAKSSIERAALFVGLGGQIGEEAKEQCQTIFVLLLQTLGLRHIKVGFDKAVDHLSQYNPREVSEHDQLGVAPLVMFLELVNVGDLILQMLDVFYEQELVAKRLTDRNDFLDPSVKEKKKFEQMLDERVAAGLNKGIDVLMAEVEYICSTTQKPTDFNPESSGDPNNQNFDIGPSHTAVQIVEIVSSHTKMLVGSTDKHMLDVFNQEVGVRLFAVLCKHIKRQRISVDGSIKLISDMNHYFLYIETLRNKDLLLYFKALRELAQIYLIGPSHAKDMAAIIADGDRFHGIFRAEEVYEFAERRADWYSVRRDVERAMYGIGCLVM